MKNPLVTQEMVRRMARRRRWRRRTRRTLLVVCSLVVLGGLAYGVDRGVIVGHRLFVGHVEHHNGVGLPAESVPVPATTTTVSGQPPCTTPQITGYLDRWQIVGGTLYEIIVLTSTLSAPCLLTGYPGLAASGQGGVIPPTPVSDVASLGAVGGASTPAPVILAVGAQAWFEVSYPVSCTVVLAPGTPATGAQGECYAGGSLQVTSPQATSALTIPQPLRFTYGTAGFQVGPFQGGPPPPSPPIG